MRPASNWLCALSWLAFSACGTSTETTHASAEEHGRALFSEHGASPSQSNVFACSTCHQTPGSAPNGSRRFPGAELAGATSRTSLWGGREVDLLRSVNDCRTLFMDAPSPWTSQDEDARAMYAYLSTFTGGGPSAPFTLMENPVPDVVAGHADSGDATYALACQACHGSLHDGRGRLAPFIPALPDEVLAQHAPLALSAQATRGVFVQKIRRGGADIPGQSMPPFAKEVLSDEDVAGLVALFGL